MVVSRFKEHVSHSIIGFWVSYNFAAQIFTVYRISGTVSFAGGLATFEVHICYLWLRLEPISVSTTWHRSNQDRSLLMSAVSWILIIFWSIFLLSDSFPAHKHFNEEHSNQKSFSYIILWSTFSGRGRLECWNFAKISLNPTKAIRSHMLTPAERLELYISKLIDASSLT